MTAFSTLNVLPDAQLANLNELGYLTMTPVQAAALPAILEGRDVRVQAKTGSGKTAKTLNSILIMGLIVTSTRFSFPFKCCIFPKFAELNDNLRGELKQFC